MTPISQIDADFLPVLIRVHPGNFRLIRVPIPPIFKTDGLYVYTSQLTTFNLF